MFFVHMPHPHSGRIPHKGWISAALTLFSDFYLTSFYSIQTIQVFLMRFWTNWICPVLVTKHIFSAYILKWVSEQI